MLDKLQEYSMKALIWAGILFWPFIILTLLIAPLFANADDNVIWSLTYFYDSLSFNGWHIADSYLAPLSNSTALLLPAYASLDILLLPYSHMVYNIPLSRP